jgi:hypothetical protein
VAQSLGAAQAQAAVERLKILAMIQLVAGARRVTIRSNPQIEQAL